MNFSSKVPLLLLFALATSSVTTATRTGRSDIQQEKGDNKNMIRSSRKQRGAGGDKLKNESQPVRMVEERVHREDLEIDDLLFLEADTYDHILAIDALSDSITAEQEKEEFDADTDEFDDEIDDLFEEEEDDDFDARGEGEDDGKRKLLSWHPPIRRYFYIRNEQTGKYLEVAGGSCHNGNNIHLWAFTGSSAQQFYWHYHNGKTYLVNACCHKVVEIAYGSCVNGANIHLWEYSDDSRQEFKYDGRFLANPICHTAMEAEDFYHYPSYNGKNVQSSWYHPRWHQPSKYWQIQSIRK